jgi:hypothetical protein
MSSPSAGPRPHRVSAGGRCQPAAASVGSGIQTATLDDGSISITYQQTEGPHKGDTGEQHSTYEYDGKTINIHWSQSPTNCTKAKVQVLKDGSLAFSNLVECAEDRLGLVLDQVGMRLWKKIK